MKANVRKTLKEKKFPKWQLAFTMIAAQMIHRDLQWYFLGQKKNPRKNLRDMAILK